MNKSKRIWSRGEVLHKVVKLSELSIKEIVEKAGYKYPTFFVHIKRADLPYEILAKYGRVLKHNFRNEFPEMADSVFGEDLVSYDSEMSHSELVADRARLRAQLQVQMERYQVLSDKYQKLLEEKLGMNGDGEELK